MKLLKIIIEDVALFDKKIEIDFFSEARVSSDEKHELIHLFNNFYANRTITFTGLNASGKTQILNAIIVALNIIQAKSINYSPRVILQSSDASNILHLDINKQVKYTIFFYDETNGKQTINKLESVISRRYDEDEGEYKYFFVDETFSVKKAKPVRSKKEIFDFTSIKEDHIITRNNGDKIHLGLSSDVSIINILFNLEKIEKLYYRDTLSYTNFNVLSGFGNIPHELITYLDSSIEELKFVKNEENKNVRVKLKFKDQVNSIELDSISELHGILSSGTVKGLGLFMDAFFTLRSGGVIVDELENHFNREIVSTFINLFLDRKMNPNGAVLIYSTHYSELLDIIPRNDSIYIVRKKRQIDIEKFSNIIKRNDISIGDIFIKGIIDDSTPKYSSENSLRNIIKERFLKK